LPRFLLAYWSFYFSALFRGEGWAATQGMLKSLILLPKKLRQRKVIQKNMTVSASYINSMLVHDLPPNAHKLRRLRSMWWRLRRKA
jgi:hypothetical protein